MESRARGAFLSAVVVIAANACSEPVVDTERTDFIVKAGTMEPARPGVDRLNETQTISMDPTRRPGWCFLVDPPNDQLYEVYSVSYLPGQPTQLTGDFAGQSEFRSGLKSAVSRVDGIRPFCFDFHAGDPIGEYRTEVFVNGSMHSELRMQVVE